ncbi:MAG: DUF5060 domain-containing protein [Neomegalonema sp.]|nr:DUF5060 domain-containing protein [Neomegalonema sp.]
MQSRTAMISGALRAWRSVVLDFEGASLSEAPATFRNYRLDLRFEHDETGLAIVAPGFFAADGVAARTGASVGGVWRVRFRPPLEGVWRWRARFRVGPNVALQDLASVDFVGAPAGEFDGASGAFKIAPSKMVPPDLRARGSAMVADGKLVFAQSGAETAARAEPAFDLLHGPEFDGASLDAGGDDALAPAAWLEGDPEWGGAAQRGRGAVGAVRKAAERGATILRVTPILSRGGAVIGGPWQTVDHKDEERSVFDVSRLEQWAALMHAAERLGVATALAIGGRDRRGAQATLAALGLDRFERRVLLRELTARFGHLNGLIWEGDQALLGEEARFLTELDPQRSRATPGVLAALSVNDAGMWPDQAAALEAADAAAAAPSPLEVSEVSEEDLAVVDLAVDPFAPSAPSSPPAAAPSMGPREPSSARAAEAKPVVEDASARADARIVERFSRKFDSIAAIDAYLAHANAVRIAALSEQTVDSLLNAIDAPAPDAPKPDAPKEAGQAGAPAEEGAPSADIEGVEPPAKGAAPQTEDVAPHEQRPEAAPSEAAAEPRDYVGEGGDLDEIDEAIAELRRSQNDAAAPPRPASPRSGGVRAARRGSKPTPPKPADLKAALSEPQGKASEPARAAQELTAKRQASAADAKPAKSPASVSADATLEAAADADGDPRSTVVAGIGDADSVVEAQSIARASGAEGAPSSRPRKLRAPGAAASGVASPRYGKPPKRPALAAQEGEAPIALSLYLMGGDAPSGDADALSLSAPLPLAALRRDGAALITRFAGAGAGRARFARLSVRIGPEEGDAFVERLDPFALFAELEGFGDAVERALADLAPTDPPPYLEIAALADRDAETPLRLWRTPFEVPTLDDDEARAPRGPSREELAVRAMESDARLVRVDLIDPDNDRVVASFGPGGFDAPIEAAGRVLNVKAIIGGRAVSAERARLFVPASARCARPEDRPSRIGSVATCHFYGCVFSAGRQEIELVAVENVDAMERLIQAPGEDPPGVLLRARVRIALS